MEIKKIEVNSEAIEGLGYDETNRILRVWLRNGKIYDYYSVPSTRYQSFIQSESHGVYYNAVIKKLYKEFKELEMHS